MSEEPEPDNAAALKAVRAFVEMGRKHVNEDDLAVALVSAGAALMASSRGVEPAIEALRNAIKELRVSTRSR